MEATAVSIGKAVLDGALDYAMSSAAEEMALQLGVKSDVSFITDELEMMQSFLMAADEERDRNNKVRTAWVKQVRDVAYNVEDSLLDFTVYTERDKPCFLGCISIPHNLCDRRRIAMEVKELKTKVEEVSNRNMRYHLIKDVSPMHGAFGPEQGGIAGETILALHESEAWGATEQEVDLRQLIIFQDVDLRVIAVWGSSGCLGKTSEIRKAYDDPSSKAKFGCRAWVTLMHPFDAEQFLRCLVRQFFANSSCQEEVSSEVQDGTTVGGNVLLKMEKMKLSDLVYVFGAQVSMNRYLIVIDGVSTIDEWDCIRIYFPDKKNGSRIVVATQQVEIASLCTEQPYQVSKLKQLSSDHVLYLFHYKVEKPETDTSMAISKSKETATGSRSSPVLSSEIEEEGGQQSIDAPGKTVMYTTSRSERKIIRRTTNTFIPKDILVGRSIEKQELMDLVVRQSHVGFRVVSVWGMDGIGKTTLVRSVYRSQELGGWKRAWANALRPFSRDELLRNLVLQLRLATKSFVETEKKNIGAMGYEQLDLELSIILQKNKCLIVLDGLTSREEWDSIKDCLVEASRIIVTTKESFVAKHCSENERNMFSLEGLDDDAALELFKKKVFKNDVSFELHPAMLNQAKVILKKCDGLPLAISTIGCYLANKPKTAMEWRKLNDGLSAELEINDELKMIKAVVMRSYDGLPYHLKANFLYLCIFPEGHIIQRKSLVRRWIAEGYCREMQQLTAEQVGDIHFNELVDRSMILSMDNGIPGKVHSCGQLHGLVREICVSKAREENLVFVLEEGCNLGSTRGGAIRHLTISSNWERDNDVIQRILDLSHVRSLTVFGEWRSFFISNKMRFLRVLDLEHTRGLRDHHLDKIGELLHLRYLSLRECKGVFSLPDSLANLGQLQTLDVRGTRIWTLPAAVAKLQKLQYLHASGLLNVPKRRPRGPFMKIRLTRSHDPSVFDRLCTCGCCSALKLRCDRVFDVCTSGYRSLLRHCQKRFHPVTEVLHLARREGYILEDGGSCRHGLRYLYRYHIMLKEDGHKLLGVRIPRGISKLRALHTLRMVNVAHGKATTFEELRGLTQLRKLGVVGVDHTNMEMFWRSIAGHNRLQSLSVDHKLQNVEEKAVLRFGINTVNHTNVETYWNLMSHNLLQSVSVDEHKQQNVGEILDQCLGEDLSPPRCLESLKMCCKLAKVAEWIHWLPNLFKLHLEEAMLNQDAVEIIGMLPNLAVLRLHKFSFSEEHLHFRRSSFRSLLLLELHGLPLRSVEFEEEAVPRLEVLQTCSCWQVKELSGLWFLKSLKEIRMDDDKLKEMVQGQLAEHRTMKLL